MPQPPLPNFIVLGAQKAATTWLFEVLRAHPQVFMPPVKELHFFDKAKNYARGEGWYREQFVDWSGEAAIGDATPNYLWTSDDPREIASDDRVADIPAAIHELLPEARLIISLRDPVDRAVSAYFHHVWRRRFSPRTSILDVADRLGIFTMGLYATHLERYLAHFSREQLLVLIYEDEIKPDPGAAMRRVYRHIGVKEDFEPPQLGGRYNSRRGSTFLKLNYYVPPLGWLLTLVPGGEQLGREPLKIPDADRRELRARYAESNGRLAELLGRALPWAGV